MLAAAHRHAGLSPAPGHRTVQVTLELDGAALGAFLMEAVLLRVNDHDDRQKLEGARALEMMLCCADRPPRPLIERDSISMAPRPSHLPPSACTGDQRDRQSHGRV